jgi:metal-responsive CopG/Arc/MetJ family transcriptional regulator
MKGWLGDARLLGFRLNKATVEAMQAVAEQEYISLSELIRRAITEYLAKKTTAA